MLYRWNITVWQAQKHIMVWCIKCSHYKFILKKSQAGQVHIETTIFFSLPEIQMLKSKEGL